ncbi:MAG: hypothetical protein NTX02_05320 [Planctomycetia bacterium]|nr:hypothetical protein [Planctomycetia bacterium]RLS29918.1 MAG: hypothetical protein DWH80_12335 [Planctomycetota bacterium]
MNTTEINPSVIVSFECIPLRGVARLDIPLDASPVFQKRLMSLQQAVSRHGTRHAYYLRSGICTFRLTNHASDGMIQFVFEGTLLTDEKDSKTVGSDLTILLDKETCDWLTQPAVQWLTLSAKRAVEVEFDRYIAAGDLSRALERLAREQAVSDAAGGYLGMNL